MNGVFWGIENAYENLIMFMLPYIQDEKGAVYAVEELPWNLDSGDGLRKLMDKDSLSDMICRLLDVEKAPPLMQGSQGVIVVGPSIHEAAKRTLGVNFWIEQMTHYHRLGGDFRVKPATVTQARKEIRGLAARARRAFDNAVFENRGITSISNGALALMKACNIDGRDLELEKRRLLHAKLDTVR